MEKLNIKSYIYFIDSQNIKEIEILNKNINKNNKNDIIFEIYNNKLLTSKRLKFLMNYCIKYFNISSNLIKKLMKDEEVNLLDIIFSNLKFFDNDFILQLLFYYKNKPTISTSALNQQISNEKFKISIIFEDHRYNKTYKYLINECIKKDINIYIIKYLVENGADINRTNKDDKTPLFYACENGHETVIKYLVEQGA